MFVDLRVGRLIEPLTGRAWDREAITDRFYRSIAHYADLGLARFDRVFLHHGNTIEFFVDLLAIWSLGGCAIPIDSRLTGFEVETLARAAAPRYSVWKEAPDSAISACLSNLGIGVLDVAGVEGSAARILPGGRLSLDLDALILFTSGTTGQPKGVVHIHGSLRARWLSLRDCLGLDGFRRTLCLLPTHFGHGLICNCLFPLLCGLDLFVPPPFRPDVPARLGSFLDAHEITFMSGVPPVWGGPDSGPGMGAP
jgi:acyl-CoA synthetase (AMP-forming)/AMP-acid ligase II